MTLLYDNLCPNMLWDITFSCVIIYKGFKKGNIKHTPIYLYSVNGNHAKYVMLWRGRSTIHKFHFEDGTNRMYLKKLGEIWNFKYKTCRSSTVPQQES